MFNIGNETEEISIRDLAQRIVGLLGKDLAVAAGPETPGSPRRRCPAMARTVNATGFRPLVGLDEGLAPTYAWYRDRVFRREPAWACG